MPALVAIGSGAGLPVMAIVVGLGPPTVNAPAPALNVMPCTVAPMLLLDVRRVVPEKVIATGKFGTRSLSQFSGSSQLSVVPPPSHVFAPLQSAELIIMPTAITSAVNQ